MPSLRAPARLGLTLALLLAGSALAADRYTFRLLAGSFGRWSSTDGDLAIARLEDPVGVAVDAAGNLYIADRNASVIRKVGPAGDVSTLAGFAHAAGTTDGLGAAARFGSLGGIAIDAGGNLFVADSINHSIRKVTPAGLVTTVAGLPGTPGSQDGPPGASRFNYPSGIAVDPSGNLYVADTSNHVIRQIRASGETVTIAGLAGTTGSADGIGAAARFNFPRAIAIGPAGDLYVADSSNHTLRKSTAAGVVTTVAGLAGDAGSADGAGSAARFNWPSAVAVSAGGDVFVTDYLNHTLRKVTPSGDVTTLAGDPTRDGNEDGTGQGARFSHPDAVAVDAAGTLFVADGNWAVKRVTAAGVVTTVVGRGRSTGSQDGSADAARFNGPEGIAVNSSGTVYVADSGGPTIRRITPAGDVTTFAGAAGQGGSEARFTSPRGMALDPDGNLYVGDAFKYTIRKITPAGAVTTVAGMPGVSGSADGTGADARFGNLSGGLASDAAGNLFIADTENHTIRKMTPDGTVTTIAGLAGFRGTADGIGAASRFYYPHGIAVDAAGNVWVLDTYNSTLRKVTPAGVVSTVCGLAGYYGNADGVGVAARFKFPYGLAIDAAGDLYVADTGNYLVRKVTPSGVVSTIAGGSIYPQSRDGTGSDARFDFMYGIAVGLDGKIYVTEGYLSDVRVGLPAIDDAATIDLGQAPVGVPRQLDTAPRTATRWEWSQVRRPSSSSAALSSATVRNPTFVPDVADGYRFQLVATGPAGQSISYVDLNTGCPVTILTSPPDRDVCEGLATTFSVTATGSPVPTSYQWYQDGSWVGSGSDLTIDPLSIYNAGTYSCGVTSSCGWAFSAPARLTVSTVPEEVSNSLVLLKAGGSLAFRWTDALPATSYSVFEDALPSRSFPTLVGSAPAGNPGLVIPMPAASPRYYRVSGENRCGQGSK